jgi:hypothetical protein
LSARVPELLVVFAVLAFTEVRSEKEAEMAMESLLAQGLATAFLVGVAWYATHIAWKTRMTRTTIGTSVSEGR